MANLERKQQKIFAENSQSIQVTAFRTAEGTPLYTKDVDEIQNANFSVGWLEEDNAGNVTPYAEDMNGVFYSFTRNLAYLYQKGIPEWSNSETYYTNAMCMYDGVLYQSLADENTNRQPDTQTSYWQPYASPVSGSVTGVDNLGTGAGISTGVTNTKIQLKSLVAGTNVTLTEASDSITIDATGGSVGSVAWGDITGSIASQVDLATALSQKGTLSGNNSWTGTNTFKSILPDTTQSRSIGSGTQSWLEGFFERIVFTANDHFSIVSENTPSNDFIFGFTLSGVGDWGIYPRTASGTSSSLGSGVYPWDSGYIDSLYVSDLNGASNATSITSNVSIVPATASLNLGSMASPWLYGYIKRHQMTGSGVAIEPTSDDKGMQLEWIDTSTRILYLAGEAIYTNSNSEVSLGDSTHIFANGYFDKLLSSEINTGATQLSLTATDHLYVIPNQAAGKNAYLGNSSNYWYSLYIRGFNFQNGNVSFNGAAGADMVILPNPPSNYNSYLGNSSYSWTGGYITTVTSNKVNFRTGTTGRASMYVLDDGRFIIERISDYGTTKTLVVRNRSAGVQLADGATSWASASDIRLKENIEPIKSALDEILHLNPVKYSLKEHHLSYADRAGFIAQEVQPYIPEVVMGAETDDEYLGLAYTEMIPFLVKAIQELSAKVDDLEKKLKEN